MNAEAINIDSAIELANAWQDAKDHSRKIEPVKRMKSRQREITVNYLLLRYGPVCFFCHKQFPEDQLTIEHLLARSNGGSNAIENIALSCSCCNTEVDDMSVIEKVLFRESKQDAA